MKRLNLWALLLGAALFIGFGATSLSAEDMKCGAGKCGGVKAAPAMKCGGEMKGQKMCPDGKHPACICGDNKPNPKCECPHHKNMKANGMKCGAGMKCGGEKKAATKCGAGKCGDAK